MEEFFFIVFASRGYASISWAFLFYMTWVLLLNFKLFQSGMIQLLSAC